MCVCVCVRVCVCTWYGCMYMMSQEVSKNSWSIFKCEFFTLNHKERFCVISGFRREVHEISVISQKSKNLKMFIYTYVTSGWLLNLTEKVHSKINISIK